MHIALIYMASGQGRRFGGNKLLALFGPQPLYQYGLEHLQGAAALLGRVPGFSCSLLVVSPYEAIRQYCQRQTIQAAPNPEAGEGIAASMRIGVAAAADADGWAFFAADQPYLHEETIAGFLSGFCQSRCSLGCVTDGVQYGSPAVFSRQYRCDLLALRGDTGGKRLLRQHWQNVWTYPVRSGELIDMDTRDDFLSFLRYNEHNT